MADAAGMTVGPRVSDAAREAWAQASGADVRAACRRGAWHRPTAGMAHGFVQANLVMLPADLADDFEAFCQANPVPCPLLERTPPGSYEPLRFAPGADLRTDAPRYRIYRRGRPDPGQPTDVLEAARPDLAGFLLGCSFTFESAMQQAGFDLRHQTQGVNVPMYRTQRACAPAGPFAGPLVVSMRPVARERVAEVRALTARFPRVHGAPVHVGDPAAIGVRDLDSPDWGDAVEIREGEVPVFWGCGVTPQAVAQASRPELMITHAPGHMFVTDRRDRELDEGS